MNVKNFLMHGWNAFRNRAPTSSEYNIGTCVSRPGTVRLRNGSERTILASIYNRIALDVASIDIRHVKLNAEGNYEDTEDSDLNNCLTLEANIDQTARAFFQEVVLTMISEGVCAVVPIDTTTNDEKSFDPNTSESYDIQSLRVGRIIRWHPRMVDVEVYNDNTGNRETLRCLKTNVAILTNPFYAVMNEPNSTMQRLSKKLGLLDYTDDENSSGKLDMIVQLPYTIRGDAKRELAKERRKEIEVQLKSSKYGIAYIDAAEKITQLNRPVENNLLKQVEYLTNCLYSQLSITPEVMNGTAEERVMLAYTDSTIRPYLDTICDEFTRKFLTKTARKQKQAIRYFRDPFKLVPVGEIAEISDKMTRNEIMSSNEVRAKIGMKPSKDPKADELRNKNLSESNQNEAMTPANVNSGLDMLPIKKTRR